MASVWAELKRRNVVKVAVAYAVVAWVLIQVVGTVFPMFHFPEWASQLITVVILIGFPIAIIFAWAFELTPEGVKPTREVEESASIAHVTGQKLNYAIIGVMAIAIGFLLIKNYLPQGPEQEDIVQEIDEPSSAVPSAENPVSVLKEEVRNVLPNSVAVLPLENLSPDPDNAYFAAGIHDTILNELANINDVNVIARTTMLRYQDTDKPIEDIAHELNVETIMEGSVQYAEGRVLVTAQLIDPKTNAHLWSESYDREFAAIFEIQADIAKRIAIALEAELLPDEQQTIETHPTESEAAYALYLRARAIQPNIGPLALPEFYDYLKRAIEIDPEFAKAHATLAFAYSFAPGYPNSSALAESPEALDALTRRHAERAINIDPHQGLAYAALAELEHAFFRTDEAQAYWERALAESPNDPEVLDDAILFYSRTGQPGLARELHNRLVALDPTSIGPARWRIPFMEGDTETVLSIIRQNISSSQSLPVVTSGFAGVWVGIVEAISGNTQTALEEFSLVEQLTPEMPPPALSMLAFGYGLAGQPGEAERILQRLKNMEADARFDYVSWPGIWLVAYAGVGNREELLSRINQIVDSPGAELRGSSADEVIIGNSYSLPVLDEPEFLELRRKLGHRG